MSASAKRPKTVPEVLEKTSEEKVSTPMDTARDRKEPIPDEQMSAMDNILDDLRKAKEWVEVAKKNASSGDHNTTSLEWNLNKSQVFMRKATVELLEGRVELAKVQELLSKEETQEHRENVRRVNAKVEKMRSKLHNLYQSFYRACQASKTFMAQQDPKTMTPLDMSSARALRNSLGNPAVNEEPIRLVSEEDLKHWPMLSRQGTAKEVFRLWGQRVHDGRNCDYLSKTMTPLIVVSGGPGSGKSRFLDALANKAERGKLLDEYQKFLEDERASTIPAAMEGKFSKELPPHQVERIKVMRNAVGVAVTFTVEMFEQVQFFRDLENVLAARVLWSHFSDRSDWEIFLRRVPRLFFLGEALRLILQDVGDKHVVLCIDEYLVWSSYVQEVDGVELKRCLELFGSELEAFPRVHHTLSTMGFRDLHSFRRAVWNFKLLPLSETSVEQLCGELFQNNVYKQILEDAYGSPWLLQLATKAIQDQLRSTAGKDTPSRATLVHLISQSDAIQKLALHGKHLIIALRAAFSGRSVNSAKEPHVNEAVEEGYLVNSRGLLETAENSLPAMPPLLVACFGVSREIGHLTGIPPLAEHLLTLGNKFLSYGPVPEAVRDQIAILIQIRCAVQSKSSDGWDVDESSRSITSFGKLLDLPACFQEHIEWGNLARVKVEVPVLLKNGYIEDEEKGQFTLDMTPHGSVWVAKRDKSVGIDLVLQAPMEDKDKAKGDLVIGIQVQFGGDGAKLLDAETIADAMIASAKREALHVPIKEGRFLFVAIPLTDVEKNLTLESVTATIKARGQGISKECKKYALKIAENVIILDRKTQSSFFTPTFSNRVPHLRADM